MKGNLITEAEVKTEGKIVTGYFIMKRFVSEFRVLLTEPDIQIMVVVPDHRQSGMEFAVKRLACFCKSMK
jgi:hypothetical protein